MLIACDFDGTCVREDRPYADVTTPLELMPYAREALTSLKAAEHILLLWSGRASRALLEDPRLNPLVRAGVVRVNRDRWLLERHIHQSRYEQMISFVTTELAGVFDAVDDGMGGKPLVDLFVDNRALRLGGGLDGVGWRQIADRYGAPVYPALFETKRR